MKPWVRYLVIGSVGVGAAAGLWWLTRGARATANQLADGSGVAAIDYTTAMPRLGRSAGAQVARAAAGEELTDYRRAEDLARFWGAPAYDAEAYFKAAYWTAVASRLVGGKGLATKATALLAKGSATYALPGSSQMDGDAEAIYTEALADIRAAGGKNRQVAAVLAALGQGKKGASAARERAAEKGWIYEGGKGALTDTAQGLAVLRGAVTGERPKGYSAVEWFAAKWGIRVVAGGVLLLGARLWWGAPILPALKHMLTAPRRLALAGPPREEE